jgi:hypothetical protein
MLENRNEQSVQHSKEQIGAPIDRGNEDRCNHDY